MHVYKLLKRSMFASMCQRFRNQHGLQAVLRQASKPWSNDYHSCFLLCLHASACYSPQSDRVPHGVTNCYIMSQEHSVKKQMCRSMSYKQHLAWPQA